VIGQQLAIFANNINDQSLVLPYGAFTHKKQELLTRVTNFGFRIGLSPATAINPFADPSRPFRIGNTLRPAYICPNIPYPKLADCVSDNFTYYYEENSRLPYRVGNYMYTEIQYLKIGSLSFITIPGELCPELATGLPQDFDEPSKVSKYYLRPQEHAVGPAYYMPGSVMGMLKCDDQNPCMMLGLLGDEIGYMFPISDWRIKCTAELLVCEETHRKGAMNFTDSMSGAACRDLVQFPTVYQKMYENQFGEDVWNIVNHTCYFGQVSGQVGPHYEETNAGSWMLAQVYIDGVAELLGVTVNATTTRYCQTPHTCAGLVPSPSFYPGN